MKDKKCDCKPLNPKIVEKVSSDMPNKKDIESLSNFFKVMGDRTRLKILTALIQTELCVSDLSCLLNMTQSAISHQLKTLKQSKLIKSRREGRAIYYSLDDNHIKDILDESLTHVLDC